MKTRLQLSFGTQCFLEWALKYFLLGRFNIRTHEYSNMATGTNVLRLVSVMDDQAQMPFITAQKWIAAVCTKSNQ